MPSIVTFVHIPTSSVAARQTVLEHLITTSQHAEADTKLCRRYTICLPRDETNETSIYVIGEYIGTEGVQEHNILPQSRALAKLIEAHPDWFGRESEMAWSEVDSSFVRPSLLTATSDPFIAAATIEYKSGKKEEGLQGWRKVTQETQKSEPEALGYYVASQHDNADVVRIVEFYPSEEYFRNVHAKSQCVLENRQKFGEGYRETFKFVLLKMVAGFLYKESEDTLVEEYN